MAAYGLYSHIQSNRRRSIALLVGLFFLVYLMVYAGALVAEALSVDAGSDVLMQLAWRDFLQAAPWATVGTALWIAIAYYFHQNMIDALTGGREVTRAEEPRLYNILENLCISRGITMPKLKVMESDALNAFATGMNDKQYSITVTTGLIKRLDDAEIEGVLGHELTHIRNGDVRMMVIAVIIAGVVSFFAELVFRLWFYNGFSFRSRSDDRRGGGAAFAILIAVAVIAVAYFLSFVIRLALSRSREFLADAGSVELTKNPDAMISALRKIEGRGELPGATSAVMEMCLDNPRARIRRAVRYPSERRQPGRGAGQVRRRPRSRPAGAAAAARKRGGRRSIRTTAAARSVGPGGGRFERGSKHIPGLIIRLTGWTMGPTLRRHVAIGSQLTISL